MNKLIWLSKLFLSIIVILIFSVNVQGKTVEYVFYQPLSSFKDNTTAVTAIRELDKLLVGKLQSSVKGYFFQKEKDLEESYMKKKPVFGFLDLRYFIKHRVDLNLKAISIPQRNNEISSQAVVVVRKDSPANQLLDLKGKMLVTTGNGQINYNFLSNYIFEGMIDVPSFFKLKKVDTSFSALYALSYKEADVAIIDKAILYSLPQKNNYKVILTTQDIIFPPLCIFNNYCSPEMEAKIKKTFLKLNLTSVAKIFDKPLKIDKWVEATEKTYKDTELTLTNKITFFEKKQILSEKSEAGQEQETSPPFLDQKTLPVMAISSQK